MRILIIFISIIALFIGKVFAEKPANNLTSKEVLKENAIILYKKAISEKGDMQTVLKAEEGFLELEKLYPDFFNRVRLASLLALKAKFSSVFKRVGLAKDSIASFDKLEKEINPNFTQNQTYEFHYFRGRTFFNFPSFLGKKDIAKSDIKQAVQILEDKNLRRENPEKARLFLTYALILKDENNPQYKEFAKKALAFNTLESEDKKIATKLIN